MGVPIPPDFVPNPRIDVEPFGELKLLDPTDVVGLIAMYINVIWTCRADDPWHGTRLLCHGQSYCLSVYLSTPFRASMVAWMVLQHLDAILAINPNDEAPQWRVGEEQFRNTETGEILAEVSTAQFPTEPGHAGGKIDEVTDLSKSLVDVGLPPQVTTTIKRLKQPVGIRSLLMHFLVALRTFVWPQRSDAPIESVYPVGTTIETPTMVSFKGLTTSMTIKFTRIVDVKPPYSFAELETGLRQLMDKIFVFTQVAIHGYIRRRGSENFAAIHIKTKSAVEVTDGAEVSDSKSE